MPEEHFSEEERTFTQSEVNRMMGQRLAKYADYDQIVAELEAVKKTRDSDIESAVNEATTKLRTELNEQWGQKFIGLRAQVIAANEGFQDPEDASRFVDLSDVSFNAEDGTLDEELLEKRVKETAENRPYLLRVRQNPAPHQVGLGTQGGEPVKDGASAFANMPGLSF